MKITYQIVIIGGGNAGISVAAKLLLKDKSLQIALVDPADKHYYQPAWTLVGGGAFNIQDTERDEASVIPKGVQWIKERVASFSPESNEINLANGD
jgi:sulfide:quinone oxidoreductase